jgi:hypothetical protein
MSNNPFSLLLPPKPLSAYEKTRRNLSTSHSQSLTNLTINKPQSASFKNLFGTSSLISVPSKSSIFHPSDNLLNHPSNYLSFLHSPQSTSSSSSDR